MLSPLHFSLGGFTRCTPLWNRGWHHESQHKLYVPKCGSAWYNSGHGEVKLVPGQLYLIPGGRRQRSRCPRQFEVWWAHFSALDTQIAAALMNQPHIRAWPTRNRAPAWELLGSFFTERPTTAELRLVSLLTDLLADLVMDQPVENTEIIRLRARLAPAAAWLDANAGTNPPLSTAAQMAGMGPAHFHRLAVTAWGETPHARVQRVRLERVRELLSTTDDTITAIAEQCGFGNPFYLTRAFRQRYGEPPSSSRARVRLSTP